MCEGEDSVFAQQKWSATAAGPMRLLCFCFIYKIFVRCKGNAQKRQNSEDNRATHTMLRPSLEQKTIFRNMRPLMLGPFLAQRSYPYRDATSFTKKSSDALRSAPKQIPGERLVNLRQ